MRRAFAIALLALLLVGACRSNPPTDAAPAGGPAASYDERELPALRDAGATIADVTRAVDTGVNVPDAEAALFDAALCREACAHLFELLAAEQRRQLADAPAALRIFEEDLRKLRPRRERTCVEECRRYADRRAVECVLSAKGREALDACDF